MTFIAFDPKKHKGKKLFEIQSEEKDDVIVFNYILSDIPFEEAAKIPWYFYVEEQPKVTFRKRATA